MEVEEEFIDFSVSERWVGAALSFKVEIEVETTALKAAVVGAIKKYLRLVHKRDATIDKVEEAVGRLKSVCCLKSDLTDLLDSRKATIKKHSTRASRQHRLAASVI